MNTEKIDSKSSEELISLAKRRKGVRATIYILPNLITATSFFCGFLSLTLSAEAGKLAEPNWDLFFYSAIAILIAGIADMLDGSVARWTRTQSAFGVQFDSLSDVVSFGIAPGFLSYQFALKNMGNLGLAAAFIFAICGALRLGRFNVQSSLGKASGNFTGIPIPMGAAPVAVLVLVYCEINGWLKNIDSLPEWKIRISQFILNNNFKNILFFSVVILLAIGMVSTFEYISHKKLKLPSKHPFKVFTLVIIATAILLSLDFVITLAVVLLLYCIHGPIMWLLWKRDRGEEESELFTSAEEDEDDSV